MQLIESNLIESVPWRNGGGLTRELLLWPDNDADWSVRITLAAIDRSGPSSHFPGVDRWFVLAGGRQLELTFPDDQLILTRQSPPLCFDGAQGPDCDLPDGPVTAFNFMVSRQHGRGNMETVSPDKAWHSEAGWRAVMTMEAASLTVGEHAPLTLPPGALAWTDAASAEPWTLSTAGGRPHAWWLAFHASR